MSETRTIGALPAGTIPDWVMLLAIAAESSRARRPLTEAETAAVIDEAHSQVWYGWHDRANGAKEMSDADGS